MLCFHELIFCCFWCVSLFAYIFLVPFLCFYFFVYLFPKEEKESVELDGWGCGDNPRRDEGRKTGQNILHEQNHYQRFFSWWNKV